MTPVRNQSEVKGLLSGINPLVSWCAFRIAATSKTDPMRIGTNDCEQNRFGSWRGATVTGSRPAKNVSALLGPGDAVVSIRETQGLSQATDESSEVCGRFQAISEKIFRYPPQTSEPFRVEKALL